jgi:CheY-like chemotaxis protein
MKKTPRETDSAHRPEKNGQKTILLVEDDPNDVFFLTYAFEQAGIADPVQTVVNSQQAIDYLAGNDRYANRDQFPMPRLVLLDLKLPGCGGLDVLRWIQQQPSLRTLLVIVLSSSSDPRDVDEAYRLGARSFLVKPLSVHKRREMAKALKKYWLDLNEFPSECAQMELA